MTTKTLGRDTVADRSPSSLQRYALCFFELFSNLWSAIRVADGASCATHRDRLTVPSYNLLINISLCSLTRFIIPWPTNPTLYLFTE